VAEPENLGEDLAVEVEIVGVGLERQEREDVALYDASWEEWGRDLERPVARG